MSEDQRIEVGDVVSRRDAHLFAPFDGVGAGVVEEVRGAAARVAFEGHLGLRHYITRLVRLGDLKKES